MPYLLFGTLEIKMKMNDEFLTYLKNESDYTEEEQDKLLSHFTKKFSNRLFNLIELINNS